jgi:hypothetical protein
VAALTSFVQASQRAKAVAPQPGRATADNNE